MKEQDLSTISRGKYNPWCERRPLVCADKERYDRAWAFFRRRDLSPSEQAAFYLHETTGCGGLEFVAFSNVRLKNHVRLPGVVVLMPCFLSESEMKGKYENKDVLVQMTVKMEQQRRFIYDGWVPITIWDAKNVQRVVRSVDEALSIFCLRTDAFFEWKPKYLPTDVAPIFNFENLHLQELEGIAKLLECLENSDRIALYRSLGWLSQGLRLNEPAARFLFSILAIEALATYIEEKLSEGSALAALRSEHVPESKRKEMREQCISDTLSKLLESNPTEAIKTAYFDCVIGIRRRLKTHLKHVFTTNPEPVTILFEQIVEGKSLYDLRNVIAHGNIDALSDVERDRVRQRIHDAERVARQYILTVLKTALGAEPFSEGIPATISTHLEDMVRSSEGITYHGPTHMALIYS